MRTFTDSRIRKSLCLMFGLISLAFSPKALGVTAYEAPPGGWIGNSWGLSFSSEYFTSRANYSDTRGSYERLAGDNHYRSIETRFRGRYNVSDRVSFFAGSGYNNVNAVDLTNDKSNSQLTELMVGANYLLTKKYVHLIPEIQASYPLAKTETNQSVPLTSDGVPYMRAGMFAYKPIKSLRLGGFAGVHIPAEGLATRFLYEATVDLRLFSMLTIGGGIDGHETLMSDSVTYAERLRTNIRASAGSQRFYGYDPALLEARAWVGFRPDRTFWIRAGYAKTLNGMHAAEGQSFLLSFIYNSPRIGGVSRESTQPPLQPAKRPNTEQAVKGFQPDAEATEQDIFDNEAEEVLPAEKGNDLDRTEKLLEKKNEQNIKK